MKINRPKLERNWSGSWFSLTKPAKWGPVPAAPACDVRNMPERSSGLPGLGSVGHRWWLLTVAWGWLGIGWVSGRWLRLVVGCCRGTLDVWLGGNRVGR